MTSTSICSEQQVLKIHGGLFVERRPESFVTYPGDVRHEERAGSFGAEPFDAYSIRDGRWWSLPLVWQPKLGISGRPEPYWLLGCCTCALGQASASGIEDPPFRTWC